MWQWYIHMPGRSSKSMAMRTFEFTGTLTVSFHSGMRLSSCTWKK